MVDDTGIPIPESEDELYCDVSDVETIIRGYGFNNSSNLTDSDVESYIKKVTRRIEKQISTSFRILELNDKVLNAITKTEQEVSRNTIGLTRRRKGIGSVKSTDRWVDVNLPHYRIDELTKLEAITSIGSNNILEDEDAYILNDRDGSLKVDYTKFVPTQSGRLADNRLKDARVSVSYTYGYDYLEDDIRDATAKLVVYEIISSDSFGDILSDAENFVSPDEFSTRMKEDAEEIIQQYK